MNKTAIKSAQENLATGIKEFDSTEEHAAAAYNGLKTVGNMLKGALEKSGKEADGPYYNALKTLSQIVGQLKSSEETGDKSLSKLAVATLKILKSE